MQSVKETAKELNEKFGNGIAFYEGQNIEYEPTGLLPLDYAIGLGGLPIGRIIEVHGQFSAAKTSLCLAIIANFQKKNIPCAFIDAEFSFSAKHAESMGVDNKKLLMIQPDFGEQAFEIMEKIIKDGTAKLIVVDSVSALTPKSEAEADFGKPQMGSQARLMATGIRKLVGQISKQKAIVIFINQLRMNIMGGQYDPYTLPGGQSLKHYSSVMMELKKEKALMKGDKIVGYPIHIKIKKNKVGLPGEECTVNLFFTEGFSSEMDLISLGEKAGLIKKVKTSYFLGETRLGVGQNQARQFLVDNPLLADELKTKL